MKTLWAIAASLALITTACGGGDEEQVSAAPTIVTGDSDADLAETESADDSTSTATDEVIALEFAACMRDEGIDMDDPTVNADGSVNLFGAGQGGGGGARGDEGFQDAFEACGGILDGATFFGNRADDSEFEDDLLEFAQCLRDQGIEVDDPDFSGGGAGAGQGGGPFGDDFDPRDPANADIVDTCGGLFGGGQRGGQ